MPCLLLLMILAFAVVPGAYSQGLSSGAGDESTRTSGSAPLSPERQARNSADLPVFYSVDRAGTLYRTADKNEPYLNLAFHEQVRVIRNDGAWSYVETTDGGRGYVNSDSISNIWIRVSKSDKTVYVYGGTELLHEIPADLAYNFFSDKVKQGSTADPDHWRTPEGKFYVVARNPNSSFYKAFVLNYPSKQHAERGLATGLITNSQYEAIIRADEAVRPPPMNTALGGLIEIHGGGTGARTSWTQGCIAIPNQTIDVLWRFVRVGTPVVVEA